MIERDQTPPTQQQPETPHFHHSPEKSELERFINRVLTWLEPYSSQILIGCLAFTVLAVGSLLFYRNMGAAQSENWQRFVTSRSAEQYLEVADLAPNDAVGQWARLQAARQFLSEGLNQVMTDRVTSDERLKKAQGEFDKLLKGNIPPEIREAALYGMATALEALSDGNLDPAIAAYEELIRQFPDSQHASWSKARIEALKSPDSTEFYAWFRTTNPKPSDRPLPQDQALPPLGELDLPEISMPPGSTSVPPGTPPGESAPAFPPEADQPASESANRPPSPAAPEPAPQATPSADGAEKPATPEKPATETPNETPTDAKTESSPKPAAESDSPQP